jgi:hypothetical protein
VREAGSKVYLGNSQPRITPEYQQLAMKNLKWNALLLITYAIPTDLEHQL